MYQRARATHCDGVGVAAVRFKANQEVARRYYLVQSDDRFESTLHLSVKQAMYPRFLRDVMMPSTWLARVAGGIAVGGPDATRQQLEVLITTFRPRLQFFQPHRPLFSFVSSY